METSQNVPKKSTITRLRVKVNSRIIFIPFQKILFIQTDGRNSLINCSENKSITTHISLKKYPEYLASGFFRSHNSIIVNCRHINSVSGLTINLEDGKEIKLSRRRKSRLLSFMEGLK